MREKTIMDNTDLLDGIEAKGKWLLRDAASLVTFMEMLAFRRPFITKAEDAMALAEDQLIDALRIVRHCRKLYADKQEGLS